MEIDSVIDDGEIPNFTLNMQYMKGAAVPTEVLNKLENHPASSKFISNMSATKTGFHTNH